MNLWIVKILITNLCCFALCTYSAGFKFINDTPYFLKVFVAGKKTRLFYTQSKTQAVSASIIDASKEFSIEPGKTFTHDGGVGGFESATIETCDAVVKFSFIIEGITGIRDWILTGNTPETFSLYIGPVGFDLELGTIQNKTVTRKTVNTCQQ